MSSKPPDEQGRALSVVFDTVLDMGMAVLGLLCKRDRLVPSALVVVDLEGEVHVIATGTADRLDKIRGHLKRAAEKADAGHWFEGGPSDDK